MEWLSKLDPNIVVPIVIALGGWLWRKARGEKKADDRTIIDSIVENFAMEMTDTYHVNDTRSIADYLKQARSYIDERIWNVLAKRGIKKTPIVKALVNEAVERWTAWLGKQILASREMKRLESPK